MLVLTASALHTRDVAVISTFLAYLAVLQSLKVCPGIPATLITVLPQHVFVPFLVWYVNVPPADHSLFAIKPSYQQQLGYASSRVISLRRMVLQMGKRRLSRMEQYSMARDPQRPFPWFKSSFRVGSR